MFFRTRRFLPLFITQFLGALNDNLLKNALVILITYRLADELGENAQVLVTMAAGIFILPFFLFSATAGQLADKYDRARLTRIIKMIELVIMVCAMLGFLTHHVTLLMAALFCMGAHSTFFGPIKYAVLPQHLAKQELLAGNAYIESGTFLAILLGTLLGGILILQPHGTWIVSLALLCVAALGYAASRRIPAAPSPSPQLVVNYNIVTETWKLLRHAYRNRRVFRSILGISWFWFIGATMLSQLPSYAKDGLGADGMVVTLFLTVFSLGIGAGSLLANKLLHGDAKPVLLPWALLAMMVTGVDLYWSSLHHAAPVSGALHGIAAFLAEPGGWRILLDLGLMAMAAGIYIVPLYAMLQQDSEATERARMIAANNIMNALFMVISALAILAMLAVHFTIPTVFLMVALANGAAALCVGEKQRLVTSR